MSRKNTYRSSIVCIALACAVAIVYAQTATFEFVRYDDPLTLTENTVVMRGLTIDGLVHAFTRAEINLYHPVTTISHMADVSWFGLDAGFHHLANVAWHALASILLFLALRSLAGRLWPSAVVAALFALHPANVESIAWISQRKDTMAACFVFAALIAYCRYTRVPTRINYAMVCGPVLLAILAKPVAVVIPVLLLVFDYWPLDRWRWQWCRIRNLAIEKIPLLALSVVGGLLALYFQSESGNAATGSLLGPVEKAAMAMHNYALYLGKVFYPVDLAYFYPYPDRVSTLKLITTAVVVGAVSGFSLWAAHRGYRYVLTGWLWFLVALAPTIGLVPVGESFLPDRYLYLSSIGIFIIVVWGTSDVLDTLQMSRREQRWIASVSAIALLGIMAFQSYHQCRVWRNTLSLAQHAVDVVPDNYAAYDMAGTALHEAGRIDEAISCFEKAITIRPDHQAAYVNLGVSYQALGRDDEALSAYLKQLEVSPGNIRAMSGLGSIWIERKNYLAAEQVYLQWSCVEPDSPKVWSNLGAARFYGKRWQASAEAFQRAAELEPGNKEHLRNSRAAMEMIHK
ncbi:MAG: tetratricopeptide repeat protein [Akkermansiaceae bacterium]|nr:tetratricopeptide repeat protein [Akkermansiaceae bacterium]